MSDSLARLRPSLGPLLVAGLRVTGPEVRLMSGLASVLTCVRSLASRSSSGLMGWRLPRMA